ncbi:MAG: carbohydrate ABC transporter permease [Clostridia bacterium]|nr:carbohydrate ABC transporter permease [Clostridia bacterium]
MNNGTKVKMSTGDKVVSVITYTIVIALCLLILLPCLNVLALSFNDGQDAARGGVFLWPRVWTLDNYKEVFQDGSIVNAYKITIARTAVGTLLSLATTSFAAYALNQTELPGRKFFIMAITFTMLFGGGTIPTYIQYNELGMLDTFWVLVIPGMIGVTHLMMVRSFFNGLPYGLQEAANLDGCGYFGVFFRIMLPLSKPILAVIGLYSAVGHWNDWYAGSFYMTSNKLWPVQTVLQQMLARAMDSTQDVKNNVAAAIAANQRAVTTDSLKMAAVVITTAPILCAYPFVQKYFAKGTLVGAIKG